jgi:hypothetical protein
MAQPLRDRPNVDAHTKNWPDKPKEVASQMFDRYGPPDEVTTERLIWHRNGPWKRTELSREEIPHRFPKPHTDLLEQFIDYRVPLERLSDIAAYDGSVIPERTRGEISARCDKEEMNFLALNLADEVARGIKTVDEARRTYTEQAMAAMMGKPAPYTERLRFEVPRGDTADPDDMTVDDALVDKAKDKLRNAFG